MYGDGQQEEIAPGTQQDHASGPNNAGPPTGFLIREHCAMEIYHDKEFSVPYVSTGITSLSVIPFGIANHMYGFYEPLIWGHLGYSETRDGVDYTRYDNELLTLLMDTYIEEWEAETIFDDNGIPTANPAFEEINSLKCTCHKTLIRNKVCAIPDEVDSLNNWMENLPHEIRERPITMIAMPGSHDAASAEMDGAIYDDTLTGLHLAQNSITVLGITTLALKMAKLDLEPVVNQYGLNDIGNCLIHNYPSCRDAWIQFVLNQDEIPFAIRSEFKIVYRIPRYKLYRIIPSNFVNPTKFSEGRQISASQN